LRRGEARFATSCALYTLYDARALYTQNPLHAPRDVRGRWQPPRGQHKRQKEHKEQRGHKEQRERSGRA
jgi:hypothetical protein